MADKGGQPTTLAQAKKLGSSTYRPTTGRNKGKIIAAVSKEELKKSKLSLRQYLNKRRKDARKTSADLSASKPTAKSVSKEEPAPTPKSKSKKYVGSSQRPDNRPVKSTPKSNTTQRKTPEDILGTREKSRAARRARQEAKTKADTSMTPEQKLKGQIGISAAAAALLGSAAIPILMRVATKHGPAFARSLGDKIKNLTSRQQQNVAQAANNAATKTKAQQQTSQMLRAAQRTQSSRKPLKKDRVEPYLPKSKKPLTKGQSSTARL